MGGDAYEELDYKLECHVDGVVIPIVVVCSVDAFDFVTNVLFGDDGVVIYDFVWCHGLLVLVLVVAPSCVLNCQWLYQCHGRLESFLVLSSY